MKAAPIAPILAALALGIFYSWVLMYFWGAYAAGNLVGEWLLEHLAARGWDTLYKVGIHAHDVILNVLLAAPFASVLVLIRRLNTWACVTAAVVAALVMVYWDTDWSSSVALLGAVGFWVDGVMLMASLPMAFAGVRFARERWGEA